LDRRLAIRREASEIFADRTSAGHALARRLLTLSETDPVLTEAPIVMALPRGGVPVGVEIARALEAPLDIVFVRKIGVPGQPELAAAAIVDGETPTIVRNEGIIRAVGMTEADLEERVRVQRAEIARRRQIYLAGRPQSPVTGSTVILVDDGIATGATMLAALRALRKQDPQAIVVAVPVCPADGGEALRSEADRFVVLEEPVPFYGVGAHYQDFRQVSDAEVTRLLAEAAGPSRG
jgi:putative phosphoribosyl transferase